MEASSELFEFRYLGTLLLIITITSLVILVNQIYHSYLADNYDRYSKKSINSIAIDKFVVSIMNTCVSKAINKYYTNTHSVIVPQEDYRLVANDAIIIFYELASTTILDSIKDYTVNEKNYLLAVAESIILNKYDQANANSDKFQEYFS